MVSVEISNVVVWASETFHLTSSNNFNTFGAFPWIHLNCSTESVIGQVTSLKCGLGLGDEEDIEIWL